MQFDPGNAINQLCARGMQLEGEGKPEEAAKLFSQAWDEASNEIEKLTAAHYVARHQKNISDKLKWDLITLKFANQIHSLEMHSLYPSLYLNIAKDYEDMGELDLASQHYQQGLKYTTHFAEDGYAKMITSGILKGIERIEKKCKM